MWNPFHFAIYYSNFDLVKYFIKEMNVNISLSAPKAFAETEKDAINTEKYPEDKILGLLLAYDRQNPTIMKFLLDECY